MEKTEVFRVRSDWNGKRKRTFAVTLALDYILMRPLCILEGKYVEMPRDEVVFCTNVIEKEEDDEEGENGGGALLFTVSHCQKSSQRCRTYEFYANDPDLPLEEAKALANEWCYAIRRSFSLPSKARSHKALVLVNPNSGSGHAPAVFRRIRPTLDAAGLDFEVVETTHMGHAEEMLRSERDLNRYSAVIIVSGDGLVHEVLNGVFQRGEDWKFHLQTLAVGVIPAGSGNALSRSLVHYQRERFDGSGLASGLFNVVRGKTQPMDLFQVTYDKSKTKVGFLSLGWGMISDIDIESEDLRFLGDLRFTLWALHRIANLRKYHGKLSYLRASQSDPELEIENLESMISKEPLSLQERMPKDLNAPLPDGWETEEEGFICVYVCNLAFIGATEILAPGAKMNDGLLWLVIVRNRLSRIDLLNMLTSVEKGAHGGIDGVDIIPCLAVRIEPSGNDRAEGTMTVDGEVIPHGPVQARVVPSACRVLTKM